MYIQILEKIHLKKKKDNNTILLITDSIKPRVAKIGFALIKKNYKVILCLNKENKEEIKRIDQLFFSNIIYFKNKTDLYRKILLFSPLVYHIFTEASVAEWAEYLICKKDVLGKIVYDQYDIYRGFVSNNLDEKAKREKFCLENADGLCCRMFETQYLKKNFNYKFKGKRILFLDYCWNTYKFTSPQKRENIRFVYGGRVLAKGLKNRDRYEIETNGFEYIAKVIQENKAYFVIIPSVSCQGSKYKKYRDLRQNYNRVLLKEPMRFTKLIRYESQMDYGIDCVELEKDILKYRQQKNNFNTEIKNKYYATNKYFDYLDAGIMPIFGRKGELFGRYLAHFNGAVGCSLEELPNKIETLRKEREINRENACKAREIFAIEKQIDRLIDFYKNI